MSSGLISKERTMTRTSTVILGMGLAAASAIALANPASIGLAPPREAAVTPAAPTVVDTPDQTRSNDVVGTPVFRDIVKSQNPVVVSITTESKVQTPLAGQMPGDDDFFRRFFGAPSAPREQLQRGLGSGFIISPQGEILTNNHVVAGADRILVGLFDNERQTYTAKVIGRDPLTDSALIRLDTPPSGIRAAQLGDSSALQPGDWVLAIGNPFHLGHTVTAGVVSYTSRPFAITEGRSQNMLQTDASINPGNSGGPLINMRSEVVGINSAILSGQAGGNIGIGFAVPINTVKALLPELRQGHVRRGRLGVQVVTAPISAEESKMLGLPNTNGAIISMVERDSPAERAGLRAGDVIVEFGGKPVSDGGDLATQVVASSAGSKVPVTFYRNQQKQTATVTIEELALDDDARRGRDGDVTARGFGLALNDLSAEVARQLSLAPGVTGALVETVEPFSAAANAGMTRGDVIIEVNRQPVKSAADAARLLRAINAGQTVFVLLNRRGNQVFVKMQRD
jgi:serine protease Do